jgi:hypothetical protein
MIEDVGMAATSDEAYAAACRRARASGRRRRRSRQDATGWPEFAPPVALSDGPLGAIQAADREIARQTALRARAVAEFAATRPATPDRAQGEAGAMSPERWAARPEVLRGVSEWAARELVVALSISAQAAEELLARSLTLVHRLPGTMAALEAGALHPGHLWPMLEKVAYVEDPDVRAETEATLLRWAAGRVVSPAQLGAKARREVAKRDAREAARRLERAIKDRGITLRPEPTDGMAAVTAILTVPEAQALYRALGAYADALDDGPDGDRRTRGQKMADCLLGLVLRPRETDIAPVQVLLTVVASLGTIAGSDEAGEIDGHTVPAEMVREFVRGLGTGGSESRHDPSGGEQLQSGSAVRSEPESPSARPRDSADQSTPWQQTEQQELERWWVEVERRVLAGELGDGPHPGCDPTAAEGWLAPAPPSDPPEWLDAPASTPTEGTPRAASDPMPAVVPPNGEGWWAAADRAVDHAAQVARRAEEAMAHARRLVRDASTVDAADEEAWQAGPGGRAGDAVDALALLRAATDAQRQDLAHLLSLTGGGGLADRPRIALTDALSGALLALTDLPALRRTGTCGTSDCRRHPESCAHDLTGRPGLEPPGPTDAYRPSAALDRWVRARDRRCRFPGCRRRVPRGGELDHHRPYPLGPTSAANLAGYCTTDHRGKHQAPGWTHTLTADGTLTVTTPTGLTAVTTPPPY